MIGPVSKTSIKHIFDQYAEDTITDEQVQRVLEPVLAMIRAGIFDRPRRKKYGFFAAPFAMVVAVAGLIAIVGGLY